MRFFLWEKTTNKGYILQRGTILGGGTQKIVNFICTIKVYEIAHSVYKFIW